ncbi:uncharacterized protein LOC122312593 [Carya illinoinensis]|uniref:uncharacterized protein LOC122312593 n=1 Tax=Carya illinoinensis TaxID=32201 RepID=UPI001C729358|nr:uncharacterized protein LOC122312593 [Carya illinoinensis]
MEDIQERWSKLRLLESEASVLNLDEEGSTVTKEKGDRSLVGKVFSDRMVSKEVLASTMAKVWWISKRADFHECGSNTFIVTFATIADKLKVLSGKPWLFDNNLFALKLFDGFNQPSTIKFDSEEFWVQLHNLPFAYMDRVHGEKTGQTLGRVIEVDLPDDGIGWGEFLRIKVELKLFQALDRGRMLSVGGLVTPVQFMTFTA